MTTHLFMVLFRWGLASLLFTATLWTEVESLPFDKSFLPVASIVGGCALIAPELIQWGSLPIQAFFSSLFFPSNRDIPPPDYVLSRVYRDQGRHSEAIDQYFTIINNHPDELLAYLEGMETAFENGAPAIAKKFHRLGLKKLKAEVAREQVERSYQTLCEAAANPPPVEEKDEESDEAREDAAFALNPDTDADVSGASGVELPENDRFGLMPEPDPQSRQVINGDDHGAEPRA